MGDFPGDFVLAISLSNIAYAIFTKVATIVYPVTSALQVVPCAMASLMQLTRCACVDDNDSADSDVRAILRDFG